MVHIKSIPNFDIKQIATSGQCFRISSHPSEPYAFTVIAYGKYLNVKQSPDNNIIEFDCSESDFKEVWQIYFDLNTNYQSFIDCIAPEDEFLTSAAAVGSGIRILRQELWETMVSFMISQNNNIPRIKSSIEKLCQRCGKQCTTVDGTIYYQFPTPTELANPENLEGMGLGYRDKYILKLAQGIASGNLDLQLLSTGALTNVDTEKYLRNIYGIGLKVANCIQLYGLHQISVFPVDTWIKKIIEEKYAGVFPIDLYQDFAGVIQQYIFNYAVHGGLKSSAPPMSK